MSIEVTYTPMAGGLDLNASTYNVKPGRLMGGQNFEKVYGRQGYRRIDGYERFDGQAKPSDATYHTITFNTGVSEITVGSTIAKGMGIIPGVPYFQGVVLAVTVTSGTWAGGNAAGTLFVTGPTADLCVSGLALYTSGLVLKATATSDSIEGIPSDALYAESLFLAQSYYRSLIAAVPGVGPILGLCVFKKALYAFRGTTSVSLDEYSLQDVCKMYKSTSSGWTEVRDLIPYVYLGTFKFFTGSFTGSSQDHAMYIVNGTMRMLKYDGTTFTEVGNIYGSESLSTSANTIDSTAPADKTFTVTTGRSWTVGEWLRVMDRTTGFMLKARVKAYSGTSLVLELFDVADFNIPVGSGLPPLSAFLVTSSDWDIFKEDRSDRPIDLLAHRDHMFLAYRYGQLQSSNTGDPMLYTTSAGLIGMGAEITGLVSLKGATLAVFCDSKISLLSGSSVTDWKLEPHSTNAGARLGTVQENVGDAIFLDDRGLTTLAATNAFGNFAPGVFSRDVAPLLSAYIGRIKASVLAKEKYQYRLYFDDGSVLSCALSATGSNINADNTECTLSKYPDVVTCFAIGDMDDGADRMFFGTSDGYVMQEDVGVSFDGEVIDSTIRLHFNQFRSPSQKKRFRKLVLELDSPSDVAVNFKQSFDLDDGTYRPTGNQSSVQDMNTVGNDGGTWAESSWDTFRWSSPVAAQAIAHIDGFGLNMNLLMWHSSAIDPCFTVQGLVIHHSKMGLAR